MAELELGPPDRLHQLVMIILDAEHPALDQIMRQRILAKYVRLSHPSPEARLAKLSVDAVDFDNVVYHCTSDRDSKDMVISVKIQHWDKLSALGAAEHLKELYGRYEAPAVEDGYDLTYQFVGLTGDDAEAAIKSFSVFYTEVLSAIFVYGVHNKVNATEIPLRDNFQCYMAQSGSNFVVVFGLEDTDDDLRRIKRVFLQEMADVKKDPQLNGCPQARFSETDQVPAEIAFLNPKFNKKLHSGWLVITLFDKHMKDAATLKKAATQLAYFYPYLQYHIKCSLAYIHYRERFKCAELLAVLNRAKPDPKAAQSFSTTVTPAGEAQIMSDVRELLSQQKELTNKVRQQLREDLSKLGVDADLKFHALPSSLARAAPVIRDVAVQGYSEQSHKILSEILGDQTALGISALLSARNQGSHPQLGVNLDSLCSDLTEISDKIQSLISEDIEHAGERCPNLTVLLGPAVTARLLELSGGIEQLSSRSSDSIYSIGSSDQRISESRGLRKGAGVIVLSPIVEQMKNMMPCEQFSRLLSGKAKLAASVDLAQSHPDGSYGQQLIADIKKRVNAATAPVPDKQQRPEPTRAMNRKSHKRAGRKAQRFKRARLGVAYKAGSI